MQFSVQFVFKLQYHKTHIWYTAQIKAEASSEEPCVCFFLLLFLLPLLFEVFLVILHGLSVSGCSARISFLSVSDKHPQKSSHEAHSTHQTFFGVERPPRSLSGCGEVLSAAQSPSHADLSDRWLYQPSSSQPPRAVCQSHVRAERPSNFIHQVLITGACHRWLSTFSRWPS